MTTGNPAGASGVWADEEVEHLRRLAEQSRTSGSSNEADWDWVVDQWGNSHTGFAGTIHRFQFDANDQHIDIKFS